MCPLNVYTGTHLLWLVVMPDLSTCSTTLFTILLLLCVHTVYREASSCMHACVNVVVYISALWVG